MGLPAAGGSALASSYYQAVEEFFVSRRGDPLFLSNADWVLVHKWRTEGVPLRVVLRGIADALDAHAHSWSRGRKVGSLRYCAAEVDAARERWTRALGAGDAGETAQTLLGYAEGLERAAGLGKRAAPIARALSDELRERAREDADPRELEPWLEAREGSLLAAVREDTAPETLKALEDAVDETLAPYRERMPARVLSQVRADGLARRLLERYGLARLSLFLA